VIKNRVDVPVEKQLEGKLHCTLGVGLKLTEGQRSVQNGSDIAVLSSVSERSSSCEAQLTRCLPALSPVEGPDPVTKCCLIQ
jgi:hypothetical protein